MALVAQASLTDKIPCAQTPPKWLPASSSAPHPYICCDARSCPYQREHTGSARPLCTVLTDNPSFYETLMQREQRRQASENNALQRVAYA